MAFEISNYLAIKIAQELCGGIDLLKATSFTQKLFNDNVSPDGIGTELTVPEYEQLIFTNNLTNFPARTDGRAVNSFAMQSADVFSEDTPYQSIGMYDQLGNLWFRKINLNRTIVAGEYQKIEAGDLEFEILFDNSQLEISNYLKVALIKELVGGVDLTKASEFSVRSFSDDVDLDGDGTELTADEYEVFTFDNDLTSFPARTDGKSILALEFSSEAAFTDDADLQSIGMYDQLNNLWFRSVFAPLTIAAGMKQRLRSLILQIS